MPDLALLLRRLGLAARYVESALGKAGGLSGRSEALAVKGFPVPIAFAVIAATGFAGALGVVAGFQTRMAALDLVVFTLPATVFLHALWTLEGRDKRRVSPFHEELGLAGGCRPGSGSVLARRLAQSPRGGRARCG